MDVVISSGRRLLSVVVVLALALAAGAVLRKPPANAATPDAVDIGTVCAGAPPAGFSDTRNTTFEDEIDCLAEAGFTKGSGNGNKYDPLKRNLRWQMATFIWRVAQSLDADDDGITLPAPTDQGFNDIAELDDEFQDAINGLAAMGVVEGTASTRFDPFSPVRRDQMASFINRTQGALQAQKDGDADGFTTTVSFFPDVTSGNVHADNVDGIASEGIVQGRADGRYAPGATVNRGQMAAFIMRWAAVIDAAGAIVGAPTEDPMCDPEDEGCTEEPTQDPTCDPGDEGCTEEPTDDPTDECDPNTETCANVNGVGMIDINADGLLGLGDLLVLDLDVDPQELLDDPGDEVLRLVDGDGTELDLVCAGVPEPCTENNGLLYVAVPGDAVVAGFSADTATLEEFTSGGDPLRILDGDAEEITGSELPPAQEILDLLEDMLSEEDLNDLLDGGGGLLEGELGDLLGDNLCDTIPILC